MTAQDTRELPTRPQDPPARLKISATQVIASALAAVTATVAASFLGVAGTVIGAALASVVTVVGNALYSHSIRRTGERVRAAVPAAQRWHSSADPNAVTARVQGTREHHTVPRVAGVHAGAGMQSAGVHAGAGPQRARRRGGVQWKKVAVWCVGTFAALCVVLTGVELATGKPLSDLLTGKKASGTTLFGAATHAKSKPSTSTSGTESSGSSDSSSTSTSSTPTDTSGTPTTTTTVTTTTTATPTTSAPSTPTDSTSATASTSTSDDANGAATPVP